MLQAAIATVNETGLTVSLEHLSFEEIIRDAGVSRSTVYRRWPYKDLFFSDLLRELAKAATPAAISSEASSAPLLRKVVLERLDWLCTPGMRQALLLELIRQSSLEEFDRMYGSTEWRTYLALHATFLSIAEDRLREALRAALDASERDFIRRIAASWSYLAGLFGYRLRPELDATFETVASLASASLRGHVIMALASPDIARQRIRAKPPGAAEAADWSPSALALASIASAFLEPDPAVVWDEDRIAQVRRTFESELLPPPPAPANRP